MTKTYGSYRKDGLDIYTFECRHCGRIWVTTGAPVGFVKSGYQNHESACGRMTPEQRRRRDLRDVKRWTNKPPRAARITIYGATGEGSE